METKFVIVRGDGMGNFLNPPGHAEHVYSVREFNVRGSRRERGSMSLSYAAGTETPYVPKHIKEHAARLLAEHPGQYTDAWERTVYSYYKHCWSPDGIERNVSKLVIATTGDPAKHAAFLFVRGFFPTAKPRLDLIENPPDDYGKSSAA